MKLRRFKKIIAGLSALVMTLTQVPLAGALADQGSEEFNYAQSEYANAPSTEDEGDPDPAEGDESEDPKPVPFDYVPGDIGNGKGANMREKAGSRRNYQMLGTLENGEKFQALYNEYVRLSEYIWNSDVDLDTENINETALLADFDYNGTTYIQRDYVFFLFLNENPIYYFWKPYDYSTIIPADYAKGADRKKIQKDIEDYILSYADAVDSTSVINSARGIHDKLCLNMTYTFDENDKPSYELWAHNIIGPVTMRTGVCQAYAYVYEMLMNYYGYDCLYCVGMAHAYEDPDLPADQTSNVNFDPEAHAWNLLKLDDGKYYCFDVCWDDADEKNLWSNDIRYYNFADGYEEMSRVHDFDLNNYGLISNDEWLPAISNDDFFMNNPDWFEDVAPECYEYDELDDGTIELYSYTPGDVRHLSIKIPEKIDGKTVTSIDNNTFSEIYNLKRVILPDTITNIGKGAFADTDIMYINIPASMKVIKKNSFSYMTIKEIVIPEGVETIEERAFFRCVLLKKVTFPSTLKTIGKEAFWNDEALKEVVLKNGLTSIGKSAFEDCYLLKTVTIGDGLVLLDDYAFRSCDNLETVTIGKGSALVIGKDVFVYYDDYTQSPTYGTTRALKRLKSLTIGDGIRKISQRAVWSSKLEAVVLGKGDELDIESYAFQSPVLTTFNIPEGTVHVGTRAVPSSYIESLEGNLKINNGWLLGLSDSVTALTIDSKVSNIIDDLGLDYGRKVRTIKVTADSPLKVFPNAFYSNDTLRSVTIENELDSIEGFRNCENLKTLTVKKPINKIDGFEYTALTKLDVTVKPINGEALLEVTCPFNDYEASLPGYDYIKESSLKELVINGTGEYTDLQCVFMNLENLEKVTFKNFKGSIHSSRYHEGFANCPKLKEVVFDESCDIDILGGRRREEVTWDEYNGQAGTGVFQNCASLESVTMPTKLNVLAAYSFANCPKLTELTFPKNMEIMGQHCCGCHIEKDAGYEYYLADDTLLMRVYLNSEAQAYAERMKNRYEIIDGPKSIRVDTGTARLKYLFDEPLELDKMKLIVTNNDDTVEELDINEAWVSGYQNDMYHTEYGVQTVTVTYAGKQATFEVEVTTDTITDVYLNLDNVKTIYLKGEKFDPTNLTLTLVLNNDPNNTMTAIPDINAIYGFNGDIIGYQTIYVPYKYTRYEYYIRVKEPETISNIEVVTGTPVKDYSPGEATALTTGIIFSYQWIKGDSTDPANAMSEGETCEAGKTYTLLCTVTPEYGTTFADGLTAAVNDKPAYLTVNDSSITISCKFTIPDSPAIENVAVTVAEPKHNMTPSNPTVALVDAYIWDTVWYKDSCSFENQLAWGQVFYGGETYIFECSVRIYDDRDYKFTSDTVGTVNGNNASVEVSDDGKTIILRYTFVAEEPPKTPVESIELYTTDPKDGENLSVPYLTTDGAEIFKYTWYNGETADDADKMNDGDKFESGKKYLLTVELVPWNGYTFNASTALTLNDEDIIPDEGSGNDLIVVKYIFTVPQKWQNGDTNHDGSVDRIDANLLSRYVAGWDGYENKIFKDVCDLNGDSEINRIDANILSRCVADWDGYREKYIK